MIKELEDAAKQNEMEKVHQSGDDPENVFIWRKQKDTYRKQYAKWRKGKGEGATPWRQSGVRVEYVHA